MPLLLQLNQLNISNRKKNEISRIPYDVRITSIFLQEKYGIIHFSNNSIPKSNTDLGDYKVFAHRGDYKFYA